MAKKAKVVGIETSSEDWQVEDDLRTMIRACEIKDDKKRYAKVQKLAKSKLVDMKKVASGERAKY